MLKVLFFGRLSDFSSALDVDAKAGISDTDSLTAYLAEKDETLGAALQKKGIRIAVNQTIIAENSALNANDEIAYMSPLSGG